MTYQSNLYLNSSDVKRIGRALIHVSNKFPLGYLTEKDYYPLIIMGLKMLGYEFEYEVGVDEGRIDFKTIGTNPTYLELAVSRRTLIDANFPQLEFVGSSEYSPELHPSQNRKEVNKLRKLDSAKGRYLLLIDLQKSTETKRMNLKKGYLKEWPPKDIPDGRPVSVIYVGRGSYSTMQFTICGRRKGRKAA